MEAPTAEIAKAVATEAEAQRKAAAVRWLGKELSPWQNRCPIRVTVAPGSSGSSCAVSSGTGNIDTTVNLLAGGTATLTATSTLSPTAAGTLSNTASVATPEGIPDPNPADNTATDTDNIVSVADLSVTNTDGRTTATPGQSVTYTIMASNGGPTSVIGATVSDTVPASFTLPSWTCVGAGGGSCTASGTGSISDVVNLPVGATVTYTLQGTVSADPASLINTATITPPGGIIDLNPGHDSATDTDLLVCSSETVVERMPAVTKVLTGSGAAP